MKVTISLEIPLTILFQEKSEKIVSQEVQLRMLYAERKQRQKEKEDWEKKLKENRREFLDVKTELQVQRNNTVCIIHLWDSGDGSIVSTVFLLHLQISASSKIVGICKRRITE